MRRFNLPYILKLFINYFLQGLLYLAPIGITVFIIYRIFVFFDALFPMSIPGLGIVVVIFCIAAIGFLGKSLLRKPIIYFIERWINKTPLVKIIYSSVKDLLGAFVGKKKKFDKPVLVRLNQDERVQKIGFITQQDLSKIGILPGKVAVYLPHSYNFSGNLIIVPIEYITPIEASSADVMKFIISGGVTDIITQEEKKHE